MALPSAAALVTGETAETIDYRELTSTWLPIVFAFVLGLSFVLLTVAFRSVVMPLVAIALNLLSVGAAYGLLLLVFVEGIGNGLLGFTQVEVIAAWLPLFLFSVLFGLSMDYTVFLLSRIREGHARGDSARDAVAHAVASTARIITGAALIIIMVFVGFASGDQVEFQQMGFGVAVSLFIDATLIRLVLLPAVLAMLGERAWYLPTWMDWLPHMEIEGGAPPARLAKLVDHLAGGALAGLHGAVQVALEVDRGVLAGEVAVALLLALDAGELRVLADLPVGVRALRPRVAGPEVDRRAAVPCRRDARAAPARSARGTAARASGGVPDAEARADRSRRCSRRGCPTCPAARGSPPRCSGSRCRRRCRRCSRASFQRRLENWTWSLELVPMPSSWIAGASAARTRPSSSRPTRRIENGSARTTRSADGHVVAEPLPERSV